MAALFGVTAFGEGHAFTEKSVFNFHEKDWHRVG
jgi:hypothetical protein